MTLNNNTLQYGKVWQFESEKFGQTDSWIVKEFTFVQRKFPNNNFWNYELREKF